MIFAARGTPAGPRPSSSDRQRRRVPRPALEVTTLEGRQLLSHGGVHAAAHAPLVPHPFAAGQIQAAANHRAQISAGNIFKNPQFYELYIGPQRANLDVVSGSAKLSPNGGLTLSGTMLGKINTRPSDASQGAYYVWGINRGGSFEVAPFVGRPGVQFNAVVVVSVQPQGIGGFVQDLQNGSIMPIDGRDIRIAGKNVTVNVDPDLLPQVPGGVPNSLYTWNLWPRISLGDPTNGNQSFVASFLPENSMAPVFAPRGPVQGNNFSGFTIGPVPHTPVGRPGGPFIPAKAFSLIPGAAPGLGLGSGTPTPIGPIIIIQPGSGGGGGTGTGGGGGTTTGPGYSPGGGSSPTG